MLDHDQRFKTLIREFFRDFLALFFADWERRLDCDAAEWLDKEVFPDPPEGPRRILDLVAKVPTRDAVRGQTAGESESWLALIHIEIESPDRATPLDRPGWWNRPGIDRLARSGRAWSPRRQSPWRAARWDTETAGRRLPFNPGADAQ